MSCAGLLGCALALGPETVHASIFGEENATLAAILSEDIAQVAEMVKTVSNLATQIQQLRTMIQQGETVLRGLKDPQGILDLLDFAQSTLGTLRRIDTDVRRLRYKLQLIDRDRQQVFPELADVPTGDFQSKARNWNAALAESSAVAMRAQTSITSLEARTTRMTRLQGDSDAAEGIVGQLQIVVRALALLHTDLGALEMNLATGQRVTAAMAGIQAAEAQRVDETNKRMLENYTYQGAPSRVLSELP
jgi:P-type conjugative transfer protein TrbJ